jgi:acetyl-CoA carboxylase carboxyltransferase component
MEYSYGAKLLYAFAEATVTKVTVFIRKVTECILLMIVVICVQILFMPRPSAEIAVMVRRGL